MNMFMGETEGTATESKPPVGTGFVNVTTGLANLFTSLTPSVTSIIDSTSSKSSGSGPVTPPATIITIPGTNTQIPSWLPIAAIGGIAILVLRNKSRKRKR